MSDLEDEIPEAAAAEEEDDEFAGLPEVSLLSQVISEVSLGIIWDLHVNNIKVRPAIHQHTLGAPGTTPVQPESMVSCHAAGHWALNLAKQIQMLSIQLQLCMAEASHTTATAAQATLMLVTSKQQVDSSSSSSSSSRGL
jgi:hypothetical protein